MGAVLSRFALPLGAPPKGESLYFHSSGDVAVTEQGLVLSSGATVSFNSYFNGLFYPKYSRYTLIERIGISLVTSGDLTASVFCQTPGGDRQVLSRMTVSGSGQRTDFPAYTLKDLPEDGAIYLELVALGTATFHAGWYETEQAPIAPVKVAAVICTYRREEYVKRNLEILRCRIWEDSSCPIADDLDVFVVDNGCSLALPEQNHVYLFPNLNYGGSGGFSRGMLEALNCPEYSHVLLMDDDVTLEAESLVKTVQILKYQKLQEPQDRPLWIGGQMLLQERPTVQYESGAFYKGRLVPVNRGLDLADWEAVLTNELEQPVDYNAWWYCCIPVQSLRQQGLTMPFFIKIDDVEYGLRCRPRIMLMDGIGLWHDSFAGKYSSHLEYYIKRNELILNALYRRGDGIVPSLWKLLRASGKALLTGEFQRINYILLAGRDFLKGPDFFTDLDDQALNSQLLDLKRTLSWKDALGALLGFIPLTVLLFWRYGRVAQEYRSRARDLTSPDFWARRLKLDPPSPEGQPEAS